jgi:hypothetical protein
MIRAPLAPSGWPMAMAPPLTLVLVRSAPVSWAQACETGRETKSRIRVVAAFPIAAAKASAAAARIEHSAQGDQGFASGTVIYVHAAPFGFHQARPSQVRQMMAHSGLAQANRCS